MNQNIYRICLTGGPCAGKTTVLVKIIERFTDRGFLVYTLPEVPTLFMNASANFLTEDKTYFYNIEKSILKFQIQMENTFYELARTVDKPVIIIADRGTMDISAYMDRNMWQAMLDELSLPEVTLRDARYDAVIHMVTAANGAEEFYTTENNAARHEGLELAREIDSRILNAWTGHQNLRVVDNNTDFDAKIGQCLATIASIVGDQAVGKSRHKYHITVEGEIPYGTETDIYEYELNTDAPGGMKVRKRGTVGNYVYFLTYFSESVDGKLVEVERLISPDDFITYLRQATSQEPVHKKRRSFIWSKQSFNIDRYISPTREYDTLHVLMGNDEGDLKLPHFVKVIKQVF
ncbi:ATP/GTP-binding protein [Porphyromonas cangingivalis]|uniref:ATPase AAA n=1 Tax=Porphyromonas cangingivalis TaxID=36874 RepID=A0A099WSP8_PORCN|nr:ATP-binding protein [Porphyromonas cangingivalis]KGL47696.1 ATPase AAA [Porphyromonas cangingivalis]KGN81579.1 ATPase AAA [Porphyromonas cangingivalis]SJZ81154.1 Predicted ATPase [Porphyromonas cangingivalis]VEJ03629.1 Uncharacterized protein conserved in bacteria [Porphyromonas cangingivalis]